MNTMRRQQDEQSRVFCELSALILNILRSPPAPIHFAGHSPDPHAPVRFSDNSPAPVNRRRPSTPPISPAGFASLLLGISLALMLCGSLVDDRTGDSLSHRRVAALAEEGGSSLETLVKFVLRCFDDALKDSTELVLENGGYRFLL
ncbi:hypothetical protein RHSIM_Rhsim12G0024500 [Rhododendron simsii]|uniref:Uncharacterized protein n=1 Tax=Rhododendron simsii TaxID=118357 RepID=A0A834G2P9_RHOSS|nr:hypothetical protein RHSIM_Rhsim12G0024500 [Rhododendron simsii]